MLRYISRILSGAYVKDGNNIELPDYVELLCELNGINNSEEVAENNIDTRSAIEITHDLFKLINRKGGKLNGRNDARS